MRDLIARRIKELTGGENDPIAISKIIAQLYFDGLQGRVEIKHGDKNVTVSPAIFLKLFQDWTAGDQEGKLKRAELKKKEKGSGGGAGSSCPPRSSTPCSDLARSRDRCGCWAKTRANRSSTTKTKTDARVRSPAPAL